jgi:micrococcal nuclease
MYEYSCTIKRVVDGDTVDVDIHLGFDVCLNNQRIRLYGLDTPESRTRDLEEKKYGKAATAFVESHLPVSSVCTLRSAKDKTGKFGRILGTFILPDGTNLNELMIAEHHAVPYFGQSKEEISAAHITNREFIQAKGEGTD